MARPVVHEDHGIGRYQGLTTLEVDGITTEFLLLEYADADKLYVPVQSLHLVTRYSGRLARARTPDTDLGSDQWAESQAQSRPNKRRDVAAELLTRLYAQRAARVGIRLEVESRPPIANTSASPLSFPFEETEDQLDAIDDVIRRLGLSGKADGPSRLRRRRLRQD